MAAITERNAPQPHFEITEDSTLFKALSCIPVLGAIPSLIQLSSLTDKSKEITDLSNPLTSARHIELIKVVSDYMKANVVNGLLCIAIAVSLIFFGIFTGLEWPLIIFGLIYSAMSLFVIYENNDLQQITRNFETVRKGSEDLQKRVETLKEKIRIRELENNPAEQN